MKIQTFKTSLKSAGSFFAPVRFRPARLKAGHVFGGGIFLPSDSIKSALHLCKSFMSGQLHLQIFDSSHLKYKSHISGRLQT